MSMPLNTTKSTTCRFRGHAVIRMAAPSTIRDPYTSLQVKSSCIYSVYMYWLIRPTFKFTSTIGFGKLQTLLLSWEKKIINCNDTVSVCYPFLNITFISYIKEEALKFQKI